MRAARQPLPAPPHLLALALSPPDPCPQVWRILQEHPDISEDRMLSEIGMLFVEGFETTGEWARTGGCGGLQGCGRAWGVWRRPPVAASARPPAAASLQPNHHSTPTPPDAPSPPQGHTTSWTLFNIATHPAVQDAIASELDSLGLLHKLGFTPRELELDDLKRMPRLSSALKEVTGRAGGARGAADAGRLLRGAAAERAAARMAGPR
jgi:hypothetical protein